MYIIQWINEFCWLSMTTINIGCSLNWSVDYVKKQMQWKKCHLTSYSLCLRAWACLRVKCDFIWSSFGQLSFVSPPVTHVGLSGNQTEQAVRLGGRHNMPPPLLTLTFDLLTLKSVWESHVTRGTPVQSFIFLGLLVFELEPMYTTSDRRTDGRRTLMTA